ncbi:hypothetical protein HOA55_03485 [archaeon]|jgi:hypothetical protein|nr:hypothetical protein [archaeon]MBT3577365.1 hypothetical protein [archaeon]MBT6820392.1 hypothetical protein [archaeon]MBT6955749.1 hypothetical protein [archaeon]MBT7025206.1 hypothetical protein [archaeon]
MKIKNNYCPIKGFAWKAGCVLGVAAVLAGAFGVGKKMYDDFNAERKFRTSTTQPTTRPTTMPTTQPTTQPYSDHELNPWNQPREGYRLTSRTNYGQE